MSRTKVSLQRVRIFCAFPEKKKKNPQNKTKKSQLTGRSWATVRLDIFVKTDRLCGEGSAQIQSLIEILSPHLDCVYNGSSSSAGFNVQVGDGHETIENKKQGRLSAARPRSNLYSSCYVINALFCFRATGVTTRYRCDSDGPLGPQSRDCSGLESTRVITVAEKPPLPALTADQQTPNPSNCLVHRTLRSVLFT